MSSVTGLALSKDETILWSGRPAQGVIFRTIDVFAIPFSLVWAGGVFGTITRSAWSHSNSPPIFFIMFFAAMAIYITVGRFVVDVWARARTHYFVTNERVVVQSGVVTATVTSLSVRTLTDVTLAERGDQTGTITFGAANSWSAWSTGMRWPGMPQQPMFERIPSARSVYDIIRDAQRRALNPAA